MASAHPEEAPPPSAGVDAAPSHTATEREAGDESVKQASGDAPDGEAKPMSKNALKRLRKQEQWEEEKDERRKRRKEKRQDRRVRRRDERAALVAQGIDPYAEWKKRVPPVNVPVSIILDCDFEQYMMDKELVSLGSQVTRSYSENRQARFRTQIWVSGWNGRLAERFHTVLEDHHHHWKGIHFVDGDFVKCAELARQKMHEHGGKMTEALQRSIDANVSWTRDETDPFPMPDPEPEPNDEYKDIVYLSSDSPYTLERLEPNTSYVVGGLVDKNREKGLCYKRARERGIRTARLPIGQYMVMQSRQVLATNHVVEIMLRWLECEDWGQAFLTVIPKRKGGQLRKPSADEGGDTPEVDEAEDDDAEHVDARDKETAKQLAQDSEHDDVQDDAASDAVKP